MFHELTPPQFEAIVKTLNGPQPQATQALGFLNTFHQTKEGVMWILNNFHSIQNPSAKSFLMISLLHFYQDYEIIPNEVIEQSRDLLFAHPIDDPTLGSAQFFFIAHLPNGFWPTFLTDLFQMPKVTVQTFMRAFASHSNTAEAEAMRESFGKTKEFYDFLAASISQGELEFLVDVANWGSLEFLLSQPVLATLSQSLDQEDTLKILLSLCKREIEPNTRKAFMYSLGIPRFYQENSEYAELVDYTGIVLFDTDQNEAFYVVASHLFATEFRSLISPLMMKFAKGQHFLEVLSNAYTALLHAEDESDFENCICIARKAFLTDVSQSAQLIQQMAQDPSLMQVPETALSLLKLLLDLARLSPPHFEGFIPNFAHLLQLQHPEPIRVYTSFFSLVCTDPALANNYFTSFMPIALQVPQELSTVAVQFVKKHKNSLNPAFIAECVSSMKHPFAKIAGWLSKTNEIIQQSLSFYSSQISSDSNLMGYALTYLSHIPLAAPDVTGPFFVALVPALNNNFVSSFVHAWIHNIAGSPPDLNALIPFCNSPSSIISIVEIMNIFHISEPSLLEFIINKSQTLLHEFGGWIDLESTLELNRLVLKALLLAAKTLNQLTDASRGNIVEIMKSITNNESTQMYSTCLTFMRKIAQIDPGVCFGQFKDFLFFPLTLYSFNPNQQGYGTVAIEMIKLHKVMFKSNPQLFASIVAQHLDPNIYFQILSLPYHDMIPNAFKFITESLK